MIDLSQTLLAELFIKSFLTGVVLGIFYDVIRTFKMFCGVRYDDSVWGIKKFRSSEKKGEGNDDGGEEAVIVSKDEPSSVKKAVTFTVTFFCDLFFWLVVGIVSIILIYDISEGVFRGMVYLGMAFGFLLYYFTIGKLVLFLMLKITDLIKMLLYKLIKILLFPLRALMRGIIFIYRLTIGKFIGKIKVRVKLWLKTRREAKKACRESQADAESDGGKEDFVYVSENCGYRRDGRIRF